MGGRFGLYTLRQGSPVQEMRAELRAALQLLGRLPESPEQPGDEDLPTGHIGTVVTPDGRIEVPEGVAPRDLSIAILTHFPYDVAGDAARVSYYESDWSDDALLDTLDRAGGMCGQRYYLDPPGIWAQTEYSVGVFQINVCAHGEDREHWRNTNNNVRKASQIYRARGNAWDDWHYTANRLGLLE